MDKLLNGIWKLTDLSSNKTFSANVPGDITMDCYLGGEIPDPKFGMNYKKARYLLERDFEYALSFKAEKPAGNERVILSFKGIDTFSEISLNGKFLGKTENMFLRYDYDVTELIKSENVLKVKMLSTLNYIKNNVNAEGFFGCFNKERIFLRKEQCCFGWDWAPDQPGYGIWDDVILSYKPACRISEAHYAADIFGNVTIFAELNYNVRLDEFKQFAEADKLRFSVAGCCGENGGGNACENGEKSGEVSIELPVKGAKNFGNLKIENPRLWNPVGYGDPALYNYKIELIRNGEVLDIYEDKLGFRSVELIEKPIGADSLSFKLKINDNDVFIKGSNWVPCECFTGEVKDEKYKKLIAMAKNAGINMLRVWGGGIYEKDIFYRLCDEAGIMVWQDFMFACADIPEMDANFVGNVEKECVYQVKRLRNHPSLVYWCGGNEKTGSCGLLKQYGDHLVDVIIRGIVDHYDGTRPYVRQSPYSKTDVGNDPESGETHGTSFDIIHLNDYNDFLKTAFNRKVSFASECAVMGSCVPETYRKFVPQSELWPLGEIYEDRFCDNPYGDLMSFVKRQEKAVGLMFGAARGIDEFAVKSMLVQAEVLKTEVENLRKNRTGCGGVMNWMFSDVWRTGTWSIIDYDCIPKIAYYYLKRAFSPVLCAVIPNGEGEYFIYLINDTKNEINARIKIENCGINGELFAEKTISATISAFSAKCLGLVDKKGDYVLAGLCFNGETHENVTFLKPFKQLDFKRDYTVETLAPVKCGKKYSADIVLRAKSYARCVHLKVPETAKVSDDWFDITAGTAKKVTVYGIEKEDVNKISVTDYSEYVCKG